MVYFIRMAETDYIKIGDRTAQMRSNWERQAAARKSRT